MKLQPERSSSTKTVWHHSHLSRWTDVFQWDEYDTLKNLLRRKKIVRRGNEAEKRHLVKRKKHSRLLIGKYILQYSAIA